MDDKMPYSEKVIDHFTNPRNMGEMEDASVVAEVGSPVCGDMMRLYLKIENDRIVDARFKTFGCAAAIASSSMLTEILKGKTLKEALEVTDGFVAQALGGLPEAKVHCSVMAEDALKAAVADWETKKREKK
jgi:nitrogen fixation protein NifU and related proteins